MESVTQDT